MSFRCLYKNNRKCVFLHVYRCVMNQQARYYISLIIGCCYHLPVMFGLVKLNVSARVMMRWVPVKRECVIYEIRNIYLVSFLLSSECYFTMIGKIFTSGKHGAEFNNISWTKCNLCIIYIGIFMVVVCLVNKNEFRVMDKIVCKIVQYWYGNREKKQMNNITFIVIWHSINFLTINLNVNIIWSDLLSQIINNNILR